MLILNYGNNNNKYCNDTISQLSFIVNNKNRKEVIKMTGEEIKKIILDAGLMIWQVADKYGCTDGNFSRKLRKDFSEADTEKVLSIIEELKANN